MGLFDKVKDMIPEDKDALKDQAQDIAGKLDDKAEDLAEKDGKLGDIAEKKQLDDQLKAALNAAVKEFSDDFSARKAAAA